jgi:hypothetical protein
MFASVRRLRGLRSESFSGNRNFEYDSSFIIRGLSELHLKVTPAADQQVAPAGQKPKEKRTGLFGFGGRSEKKAPPTHYSTAETKIGVLLADPAAKAIIDEYFPGVSADKRIGMAKGMTLRGIQKFAPEMFQGDLLDKADAQLLKLPVAK